jgi:3-oxoacyl-[acyl-carrier-protein] synthase-3
VENVTFRGNTASTTHFVALYEQLQSRKFKPGETIALISVASGLEIGVLVFDVDDIVERYGHH